MNTTFESNIKVVLHNADTIYDRLADLSNLQNMMPPDKVTNWTATADACRFTVDKVGEVGLRIVDRTPKNTIKYSADGNTQFNFYLWVQLKEVAPADSRLKVTMKADLNPMMKMLAAKPLQKFVDMLADAIAKHNYDAQ